MLSVVLTAWFESCSRRQWAQRVAGLTLCLLLLGVGVPAGAQERPTVMASIKPIQLILAAVAGEDLEVSLLLQPGVSPHVYHLRPSDVGRISDADLVVWIGPGLETFLAPVLRSTKPARVLTLLQQPALRSKISGQTASNGHNHISHTEQVDAHLWLDPLLGIEIARLAASTFSDMLPNRANEFQSRLQAFEQAVRDADRTIAQQLQPLQRQGFVVTHDGFGYWVRHYGLNQVAALTLSPERQPGARHLAQLRQTLEDAKARCILLEPQFQPSYLNNLTEGLDLRLQTVDPYGGAIKSGAQAYPLFLEAVAQAFTQCLR